MPTHGLELDHTLGALVIGSIVSSILFGFNCLQTFIYYKRYERDPITLKLLVFVLWILDAFVIVLVLKTLYYYCVTNFANILFNGGYVATASAIVTSYANSIMRFFFIRKVYILSGEIWILPVLITAFSLTSAGVATHFSVKTFHDEVFADFSHFMTDLYVIYSCAVAADVLIAASLTYYLITRSRRSIIPKTKSLLATLTVYCINTCAVVCLTHILILITFVTMRNLIYLAVFVCSTNVYYGAFLGNLNARDHLREKSQVSVIPMEPLKGLSHSDHRRAKADVLQFATSSQPESIPPGLSKVEGTVNSNTPYSGPPVSQHE